MATPGATDSVLFLGKDLLAFQRKTMFIYPHESGVSFRKPEIYIVLSTVEGAPKVIDPGMAKKALRRASRGTSGGCFSGGLEHLGGRAVQRAASVLTVLLPLALLAALRRLEGRRARSR